MATKNIDWNRIGLHLLWWLFFIWFYSSTELYRFKLETDIWLNAEQIFSLYFKVAITTIVIACMAYSHLYVLVPHFLNQKKYIIYGLGLIIVAAIFTYPYMISFSSLLEDRVTYGGNNKVPDSNYLYWFTPTFSAVLLISAMTTGLKYGRDIFTQLQLSKELKQKQQVSELNLLKTQTNPHFFFNTLNNLYALAKRGSDKTENILSKFHGLMHYMVHDCKNNLVPLQKEFSFINSYLELEKIRLDDRAIINYQIDGQLNGFKIEPLLFISFIENAFKHGVNTQLDNAFVNIDFKLANNKLYFAIANNYENGTKENVGNMGLTNVKRRLEILYPKQHQLNIKDNGNVYQVDLELQLKH